MQPLIISVFAPFKVYYNDVVKSWLLNHPGVPITIYVIAPCVNIAYEKSFTITNIQSGFRKSGIFTFDKNFLLIMYFQKQIFYVVLLLIETIQVHIKKILEKL